MGAVNYKTSDFITLGIELYDYDDFTDENGNIDYDGLSWEYETDYDNMESILSKYNFEYFKVSLESGYYEGFSLQIEYYGCSDWSTGKLYLDDYTERRELSKELTQLKCLLQELVNNGMRVVYPGWLTSYLTREDSIKKINETIKGMRSDFAKLPTWNQLKGVS